MSTGHVENWNGDLMQLGPLYPFPGSEVLLVVLGFVFFIGWFLIQWRMESANYKDDLNTLKSNGNMERAMKGEKVLRPM